MKDRVNLFVKRMLGLGSLVLGALPASLLFFRLKQRWRLWATWSIHIFCIDVATLFSKFSCHLVDDTSSQLLFQLISPEICAN